jgi:hypothetical protein
MPKQVFRDGKLTIELDLSDPKDRLKDFEKQYKDKNLKGLTQAQKADLLDAYVDAGVIAL